jgi:hypothetical protein
MPVRSSGVRSRGGGFDLFILLGIVIFVASGVLAVGVFLYTQYLSTNAASKLEQIHRAKQAFEPALISDLTRLDSRMRAADTVLDGHLAPTMLFRLLEQLTLQTVTFSAFDLSSSPDGLTLVMKGTAQSVNSIALQADLLSRSGVISNPIFSNINRQINGVNFDFSADVNAAALNYAARTRSAGVPAEERIAPEEPASPFGTPNDESEQQPPPQDSGTSETEASTEEQPSL